MVSVFGSPPATVTGIRFGLRLLRARDGDAEHAILEGHLNVAGVEAGNRRFDDECAVGLLDVDREARVLDTVARRGGRRLEQMIHLACRSNRSFQDSNELLPFPRSPVRGSAGVALVRHRFVPAPRRGKRRQRDRELSPGTRRGASRRSPSSPRQACLHGRRAARTACAPDGTGGSAPRRARRR